MGGSRVALVAGVGPSLGGAIARALAAAGCDLILVGRHREHLETCRQTTEAAGGHAVVVVADVARPGWTQALIAHGPIDIAVWVASAYAPFERVEAVSVEDFDTVHATGLRGPFLMAQHVLPTMVARGFGRVVVVGSIAGRQGGVGQAAYASAKAGLVGLVRTLAVEGGPGGVTANLVVPGWVDTARTERFDAKIRAAFLARTAVGRAASVEEVAALVCFLASDVAGSITGACIPVDGGFGLGLG